MTLKKLIDAVKSYNPNANLKLIEKAYEFAKEAHKGQKRVSGESYFSHCEYVAMLLTELKLNSTTIAAGLLHDILEDTKIRPQKLQDEFGPEIFNLVEGVTKIERISLEMTDEEKAQYIRKILLATIKDVRVILIKLVDRLHNMKTLKHLSDEKQKRIAKETLDIYAPIAHKLGIYKIKSELEDLSLRYIDAEAYQDLKKKISEKREARENKIAEVVKVLKDMIESQNIEATVYGRAKTFYSIYKKIKTRNKTFDTIFDLYAFRIITNSVEDCYKILGHIHSKWRYLPSQFSDYIANPKPNGYQSIHTKILYTGQPIEIQIRSRDMHLEAEEGIAAHWRYKGTERDKKFDRKIGWLRQLLEWERTSSNAKELIETLKIDLFKDEIIVFTPKGEPLALPEGSTPIDFAYEIHTNIGNKCIRCKVNNQVVPLDSVLKSGDVVEIMTQNNAKPSRQWLNFARTNLARSKIRSAIGIEGERMKKRARETQEELSEIEVEGIANPVMKFTKCCSPVKGEAIYGFKMKDGKIAIHSHECPNLKTMSNLKPVNVAWKAKEKKVRMKKLNIIVNDRVGLLSEILNLIAKRDINISSIFSEARRKHVMISLVLEIKKEDNLEELINHIVIIKEVVDVVSVDV
ncbi:RelA/SpoT family protein [Candidatus Woesearchaeota archaeon]|nr:RelA/SpoT family protein [Candidatus Woesearchaeota archaeon]MBW3021386.1 RelA/SpoT family protein [Candidatus Woesearchaeota archaeon]